MHPFSNDGLLKQFDIFENMPIHFLAESYEIDKIDTFSFPSIQYKATARSGLSGSVQS